MTRTLLPILAATVVAAACAGPQNRPQGDGRSSFDGGLILNSAALFFAGMDADGDYAIDRSELSEGLTAGFAAADADRSGGITAIEYQAWAQAALGSKDALPGRISLDVNADNTITETEFRTGFTDIADGYGMSTRGEIAFVKLVRYVPPVRPTNGDWNRDVNIERGRR